MKTEQPLDDNLYNRLTDETAIKLDAIATKYPSIHRTIKTNLKDHTLYINLPFEIAFDMRVYLGCDLNTFSNYFKFDEN